MIKHLTSWPLNELVKLTILWTTGPRLGSEPKAAPQNRSSTLKFCVKSTSNISEICTMPSLILKKPLVGYGMQPYGPPRGSTISEKIECAAQGSSQLRWMAAWELRFRTTVWVRPPALFIMFFKQIMSNALEEQEKTLAYTAEILPVFGCSIRGRTGNRSTNWKPR